MQGDNKEKWYFQPYGITTSIYTVFSRGSGYKVYGDDLLKWMARELKLTRPQLLDFIDCDKDQTDIENIYLEKGLFSQQQAELLTKRRET